MNPVPLSQVRTLQVIVGAMIMGCVVFAVVAVVVGTMAGKPADRPLLTYVAVALAAILIVTRSVVLKAIAALGRRQILQHKTGTASGGASENSTTSEELDFETAQLMQSRTSQTITGAAMLEGAAFFSLVTYIVEHSPISLAVVLVLLAFLVVRFPTESRTTAWLEDQQRRLQEERSW
jgi:hypothetical protein